MYETWEGLESGTAPGSERRRSPGGASRSGDSGAGAPRAGEGLPPAEPPVVNEYPEEGCYAGGVAGIPGGVSRRPSELPVPDYRSSPGISSPPEERGDGFGAASLPGLAGMIGPRPYAATEGVERTAAALRQAGGGSPRGKRLASPEEIARRQSFTPSQRLLVLDAWKRSGLPAGDFAGLVGLSKHTLYAWSDRFAKQGPAGLQDQPRGGPKGSRLPELTKRAILMIKQANPDYGCQRISDLLARGPALPASAASVSKVLQEAGYVLEEEATSPHPDIIRRFERARPNQLWQTDIFTFVLKRQNRRVYLTAFMDDHSRFLVGYGLHAGASATWVLEVLRTAIGSFQAPEEILTDNGSQYITWRGKSAFAKECEKRGIRQIVATPRHPQTLGKIERFWGTLWREFLNTAVFLDLEDARHRIGLFIDHYNFQRPHQGIDGMLPADRYFGAASEILQGMKKRLKENALDLAVNGIPRRPFYLTGQMGGKPFSLHREGERTFLMEEGGVREEVELVTPQALSSAEIEAAIAAEEAMPQCPEGRIPDMAGTNDIPGPSAPILSDGLRALAAERLAQAEGQG